MLPNIIQNIERNISLEQILAYHNAKASQTEGRYFCPLRRCTGDKHPHFVIDKSVARDQYGKAIDFTHHINKDVNVRYKWSCEHSHTTGYGSVSLLSAILGYGTDLNRLSRHQWERVITLASDISGLPHTELESSARNGWLLTNQPSSRWSVRISDGFTPEALRIIGIEGLEGICYDDVSDMLHRMFGLWQVEKYVTAGCYPNSSHRDGEFLSYERRAHALFPIFAFCYDAVNGLPLTDNPEKRTEPWVARILMPAFVRRSGDDFDWKSDFWTAFCVDDAREAVHNFKRNFSIYGDVIAMQCSRLSSSPTPNVSSSTSSPHDPSSTSPLNDPSSPHIAVDSSTSAISVLSFYKSNEQILTKKEEEVEIELTDKKGKPTGKTKIEIRPVPMQPHEIKLNKCVLCKSPLDAVATYIWLNYPRHRIPNGIHSNNYWHVAWLSDERSLLNVFENNMLRRIAVDVFELFGNDRAEISLANTNALRYNYLRLCMLPTSMSEMDAVDGGIGVRHTPHTPIDFFRYYAPTMDELARNMLIVGSDTGCKALMLQKELNGSSALKPFTRQNKKKKAPNEKGYTYEININAAWQMMTNKGYCRSLLPNKKRDTIGQCYRVDGHFVYELDPDSVMADMRNALEDYAKDNATDPEDAEMMMNAMLRCKDLQYAKNITKLRLMAMPKSESYGPELDYFFFRNGALEITPGHITFRSYSDIDFLVYASQVLPFDYHQPFYGNHSPITIRQSAEFDKLKKKYDDARSNGAPEDELLSLRQRLNDRSVVGRWDIIISPSYEKIDDRVVVPKKILEDTQHNQWLRWWPFLRLLRCFANENYKHEEDGKFLDGDREELMARMANLMFTIGRCIFRYRGVQYMPYFLENTVDKEGKAQGGSGKSVLIEHFVKFVRYVCNVNGKDIKDTGDFAKNFSNFIPHHDDVVHIEDFPKMAIDPLFNYASGKFRSRSLFENPVEIEHSESPNIVITSNFMVQSTDESSLGRVQFGGMSHYFSREVAVMNKDGRKLDTIMPDIHINCDQSDYGHIYSDEQRGQIIYTLAKCLQFTMICTKMSVQVAVPGNDLLERLSKNVVGDKFYEWINSLLRKDYIYNVPIAINELFESFRMVREASKKYDESLSRAKFYEYIQVYCSMPAHGVLFMPIKPFLSESDKDRSNKKHDDGNEKSYLRKSCSWLTRYFVDEEGSLHRARVLSNNGGDSKTGGAVWFSRRGSEPKTKEEFDRMLAEFMSAPDPEPILDENENPITKETYSKWTMLNTEADAEIIRKAGGVRRSQPSPANTSVESSPIVTNNNSLTGEAFVEGSLPF